MQQKDILVEDKKRINFYINHWEKKLQTHIKTLQFTQSLDYSGQCHPEIQMIQISINFLKHFDEVTLSYLALHEVAHQKVYDRWERLVVPHGIIWKRTMNKHMPDWKIEDKYLNECANDCFEYQLHHTLKMMVEGR